MSDDAMPSTRDRLPPALVRIATAADATTLGRQRADMFRDMGRLDEATYEPLLVASAEYFARAIPVGEYIGWIATPHDARDTPIGGAGVQVRTMLPRPNERGTALLPGPEGIVLNVYTDQAWRRRGIAELLMRHVLDWARGRGLGRLVLHASDDGRPLYEKLGFVATNEMRLRASD
jgi:GNAT superfamily N-acetyltransferase